MTSTPTQALAEALIARPSVTPDDAGCQALLAERLQALGFVCERLEYGAVSNLWARRPGDGPLLAFAGHTDVVPPGDLADWQSDPFVPSVRDGVLYGRGSADMKGALAAMLVATERFLARCPRPRGSLAWLITSDEEGPARDGTRRVMRTLGERGEQIDWCLVGEPSSSQWAGDTLRHGRRGSLSGTLRVLGVQGHVAYPERALNPVHAFAPVMAALAGMHWDDGDADFPPTSFQISNIRAGTGANNVIPGRLEVEFNFRFGPASSEAGLRAAVEQMLAHAGCRYEIDWHLSGEPFVTRGGALIDAAGAACEAVTGAAPQLDTGGGTSDGRFIAPTGAQVVELGLCNPSIHKIDEHAALTDLEALTAIYEQVLERLLGGG